MVFSFASFTDSLTYIFSTGFRTMLSLDFGGEFNFVSIFGVVWTNGASSNFIFGSLVFIDELLLVKVTLGDTCSMQL